jgi:glycine hydroxymethyltransferase
MEDYLFRGSLADFDPDIADLINLEAERQIKRLIMIPSESTIPYAVREALHSHFHNLYTEGYPPEEQRHMAEEDILDIDLRLAEYRRYGDPRYYKGTDYANLVESLARRRGAQLFATPKYGADQLYVNVQPLSGAPANSAVYTALITPGDTIMGLNLLHGGHLTHGSPVARSGKQYKVVFYGVDPQTELLDYEGAMRLAVEHKPKIIVGGYTSYPYAADWAKLRQIADACGALLLADIAHVAGLVIAGVYPSPVGIADIVSFTTHKTLGGPRGAVLITHRADLAKKLDRGVFPGEQGGPHMNSIAGLAVAFKLAATLQFKALQEQTVKNAVHLAQMLSQNGVRVVHGGTDTHMVLVDCKPVVGADGAKLSGDITARVLDLVGITCNRNTLPGDPSALYPSGIRLGTPWITQRGFRESHIERLAAVIAGIVKQAKPFRYVGADGKADPRAKWEYAVLAEARGEVRALIASVGIDYALPFVGEAMPEKGRMHNALDYLDGDAGALEIRGEAAAHFLRYALTSPVYGLKPSQAEATSILYKDGEMIAQAILEMVAEGCYRLYMKNGAGEVAMWLGALSDGFIIHDETDIYGKIPGAVAIYPVSGVVPQGLKATPPFIDKDYFVGAYGEGLARGAELPRFVWHEAADAPIKRTVLFDLHRELGAKMVPFAGYDMPVWYKSVSAEHAAVRTASGLYDVTHMGVWEVSGPMAEHFLQTITTNDVAALKPGSAHYSYFLDVDGVPLDDLYIYRMGPQTFMLVVNASNNDKDWAWVQAIRAGTVQIDPARPWAKVLADPESVILRDLRAESSGPDRRLDVALQGPNSQNILLGLAGAEADKKRIKAMGWSTVTRATLGGFDLIISRTGYTGERIAYELFVHPDQAVALFKALVEAGAVPCGLASRDSTRIEAGLPLYGHELGTERNFTPGDAGFAGYAKLWKPFFVGKAAYAAREANRDAVITRFRIVGKGVRPPQPGAAIIDKRGRVVGIVTSCSIDSEGFQTGQAYLKLEFAAEGTAVGIVNGGLKTAKADLAIGDKVAVPDDAMVLTHFPAKKK